MSRIFQLSGGIDEILHEIAKQVQVPHMTLLHLERSMRQ